MITLDKADLDELVKLNEDAKKTEGKDFSSVAWDRVAHKMDELGTKYGFNAKEIRGINATTGEVCL